jgi:alpha-glucosidase
MTKGPRLSRLGCLAGLVLILARPAPAAADDGAGFRLESPDGRLAVTVRAADGIRWDVALRGRVLMPDCACALAVDDAGVGAAPQVAAAVRRRVDGVLEPPVPQKAARIPERYAELRLELAGGAAVVFRAYNEGVAYRFETAFPSERVTVRGETAEFRFAGDPDVYFPREDGFFSHNERAFVRLPLRDVTPAMLGSLPAVVAAPGGVRLAVAEADVEDYPGLWLRGNGRDGLAAAFPPLPAEERLDGDRHLRVTRAADSIAVTAGRRAYPWRLVAVAERDVDLLTNPLVYLLAKPSQVPDTAWIRPGKVAWDWWNAHNLAGVNFPAGVNTATYKHYIDFAAAHGIEYVILDEGWYPLGDLLRVVPELDMDALAAHARAKGVGLILWVIWKTLDDQFDAAFDRFARWGVKGLKVDFMQRDDQRLMGFYHRVCREAARRHMLVDFHGAVRPALLTRTWPNLLTTEGVRGLEHSKWSADADPEHNVTLPFTRMLLGPMDYTPGAMWNAARASFAPVFEQPMSLGTRCHQLAMYVVYESPLQMLCDSPSRYAREPEAMAFLSAVPTVWDETVALDGRIGDWVAVARRRGGEWFVGAMTDWTARELALDLSFLPPGRYRLTAWADGANAGRWGSDFRVMERTVDRETTLTVRLAPGGGWAGRIVKS